MQLKEDFLRQPLGRLLAVPLKVTSDPRLQIGPQWRWGPQSQTTRISGTLSNTVTSRACKASGLLKFCKNLKTASVLAAAWAREGAEVG